MNMSYARETLTILSYPETGIGDFITRPAGLESAAQLCVNCDGGKHFPAVHV